MKIIEYRAEDYNFKKAMQENIKENLEPLLSSKKFIRYGNSKYVREINNLLQIIEFQITKDSLKAFATYLPIYLPWDGLMCFGIEVTGTKNLKSGEYVSYIYEENKDNKIFQLQSYKNKHLPLLEKLLLAIKEGILPEMDIINSLASFMKCLGDMEASFFGKKYNDRLRNGVVYKYTIAVYKCLTEKYKQGIKELVELKELLGNDSSLSDPEVEIQRYINEILISLKGEFPIDFLNTFDRLCNERRRKYKLLKK